MGRKVGCLHCRNDCDNTTPPADVCPLYAIHTDSLDPGSRPLLAVIIRSKYPSTWSRTAERSRELESATLPDIQCFLGGCYGSVSGVRSSHGALGTHALCIGTTARHTEDAPLRNEGLIYLSESYNCVAHNLSPIRVDIDLPAFEGAGYQFPFCGDVQ